MSSCAAIRAKRHCSPGQCIDIDYTDERKLEAMASLSASYFVDTASDGWFHGWLAHSGEHAVGEGALIVSPCLAHPHDLECRRHPPRQRRRCHLYESMGFELSTEMRLKLR